MRTPYTHTRNVLVRTYVCIRMYNVMWERLTTIARLIYFSTPHVALYSLGWRQL